MEIILWIISLVIAYLIGSISPAYILGRLVKHIDIRKYGSKNAGAMNASLVIGKWAGILTALFDMLKGIIAFYITFLIFNVPLWFPNASSIPIAAYFAGFLAVLGHDFPFYLNFKGGKGAATAYGLIFLLSVFLFNTVSQIGGINAMMPLVFTLIIFSVCGIIFHYIQRSGNLTAFVAIPIWLIIVWINVLKFDSNLIVFASALTFFMIYVIFTSIITVKNIKNLKREIRFRKKRKKINVARKLLRLSALIFPLLYFILPKFWLLSIATVFFLFFIYQDMTRTMKKSHMKAFYKKGERKISNITLLLLGIIITVALFQKEHSILAISMMIIGDMTAEIIGVNFGKRKIVFGKSLKGTLSCFAGCLLIGLLLMPFLNLNIYFIGIAAAVGALVELFSAWLDNLTMAPVIALVLRFLPRLGL